MSVPGDLTARQKKIGRPFFIWNADISSVKDAQAARLAATPDKDRKEAYKYTGATR